MRTTQSTPATTQTVKIHLLVPLKQPISGVDYRVACQHAFKFSTSRQLRGTLDKDEVTCTKCLSRMG